MKFDVYGPYPIKREGKVVTQKTCDAYLESVEDDYDWSNARGCYILAVTAGGGWTPWYVGKAAKTSLHKTSLKSRNIVLFNEALKDKSKAKPVTFLLPKITPKGAFSTNQRGIAELERMLIGLAFQQNPDLLNKSQTKCWKITELVGVMNTSAPKATQAAVRLRKTLGLKKPFGKPLGT